MPGLTPYVTPTMVINAPTGVSWSLIPSNKATSQQQLDEQFNMCQRATAIVDGYMNQVIRSTIDSEFLYGPGDYRVNIQNGTGNCRLILSRWPITQILGVAVSGNAVFPRQFTNLPTGFFDIERPVLGVYQSTSPTGSGDGGQSIILAPGFVDWRQGRNGFRILVSYTNGWPHTSLTTAVTAGATTLPVDDVTGWAGATGTIFDATLRESIQVTSVTANTPLVLPNNLGTAQTGPGTLTLSAPLSFAHAAGTVVTTMPGSILWATMLQVAAQALEAGITSVSIQNIPGSLTSGGKGVNDLLLESDLLLAPYRRLI